ncbi:TPM domain-containing protein [Corynebacterium sp. LK2510]|uniref:TPM domain-containing protein n=1 Tax=Corynebacterium sp. LK2510 TaxID=3110472 RepID=UPI0034CE4A5B
MKKRSFRILVAAPVLAGGTLALAGAPAALALAPSVHTTQLAQAQATAPGRLVNPVTDQAGVLSPAELERVEQAIQRVATEHQRAVRVVYLDSFGAMSPEQWVQRAVDASGSNVAVIAISPDERSFYVQGGEMWSQSDVDRMYDAAYERLTQKDWAGAGIAAAEAASGSGGSGSGSSSGSDLGWAAGGVGLIALAGGGMWAATRRSSKKTHAKQLASAKALDPADANALGNLPTPTLEELARDALVTSDESIRQGKEELDLATSEFGPERVRPFTSAMNSAASTLQRAFATHQKLYDAIPETEPEKRAMLIDIITTCGQANKALQERSAEFNDMRGVLINSEKEIEKITQRTIDIRTRLEPAASLLDALRTRHSESFLTSLEDNVDVARASLDEAERMLGEAREVAAKPAGRQGALVDLLATASHAVEVSDTNLTAIEHAEDNIRSAQANLPALVREIEDELREIEQLKAARTQGANVDVAALDAVSAEARRRLDAMGDRAETDPLSLYTELTDLDSRIDAEIDRARGAATDQNRQLQVLDQQLRASAAQIQSAEDLINSRGRIIGSRARTLLADAKRQFNEARNRRTKDTRNAIAFARESAETARRAAGAANDDISRYRQSQAQSTAGNIANAVIWGSILSGGFGGGGGGGFGGGGGGGFSGGGPSARGGMF